jgi:hypothetical protein
MLARTEPKRSEAFGVKTTRLKKKLTKMKRTIAP